MRAPPDGDLARLHLKLKGIPPWGAAALILSSSLVLGPLGGGVVVCLIWWLTRSRWARTGSVRWWSRALGPLALVMFVLAVAIQQPLLLTVVGGLLCLMQVCMWWFIRSMTRPGSGLRRAVHWPGALMTGLMGLAGAGIAGLILSEALLASVGGAVIGLTVVTLVVAHVLLLFPIGQLTRVWVADAGQPVDHIAAVGDALRARGMGVSGDARSLTATDGALQVEMDVLQAPCRLAIIQRLPGLPESLLIRARQEGDPPGVRLEDPILSDLLLVTCDDPEAARRLLAGQHELLLTCLHPWKKSTLAGGVLTVEMRGPPFVPPGTVGPEEAPGPLHTLRAFEAQLDAVQQLAEALGGGAVAREAEARRLPEWQGVAPG